MGLAASLSYSSSRSDSFPGPQSLSHRRSSLEPVQGGVSPENEQDDEQAEEDGLPTIRESSRSSSNADLLTPRVSLGGRALARGPEEEQTTEGGDLSPRTASGPSGLSLLLKRGSPTRRDAGTDRLASGAGGVVAGLVAPEIDDGKGVGVGEFPTISPGSVTFLFGVADGV